MKTPNLYSQILFNECPDTGSSEGTVIDIQVDQNQVKVLTAEQKTITFDLDGSSWDQTGTYKRESWDSCLRSPYEY